MVCMEWEVVVAMSAWRGEMKQVDSFWLIRARCLSLGIWTFGCKRER